ncbi:MAG: extracellular solute-binding protein [Hyphomicrobium sp.]
MRLAETLRHSWLVAFAMAALAGVTGAANAEPRHGLSIFGELKYAPDFTHFDYANPDAPKGGRMSLIGSGGVTTFDSFNNFIIKGDAAQGLELLFDSLMVRAADEPDAVYGLVAKSAELADDRMSVTFKLRPEAKFADGAPITAEDVANSFALLKEKGRPVYRFSLAGVERAEAIDAETVKYSFSGDLVRDLPIIVAELPVLSKAFYTANAFDETSLKAPLGSGPYSISDHRPGSQVTYKRRNDYWAKDLAVNRGRFNFDEIRFEYFRDRTIGLENLKAGAFDFREEFTSVNWATSYDIAAVKDGRLVKESLPDGSPSGAQGFFMNLRRDKFKDARVREAFGLAFDFEWSNKKLFYDLYKRTTSYFENSDMKAVGPPSAEELALLEPFRDKLPPAVFGEAVLPPLTDGSGNNRENLKKARDLLVAAGWKKADKVEFLLFEDGFVRIIDPYVSNLRKIGVDASIRMVDPAQYEQRMKSFDFDVAIQRYSLRLTPGVELRTFWSSEAAKQDGSYNLAGISDPVVDALIDKAIAAKSRAELVTATRAVDRVLRASHYWTPQWYKASHGVVYWNKFSRPATKPLYDIGVLDTWWFDPAKAKTLADVQAGASAAKDETRP